MYSPAERPSRQRAAPAKKRSWSAITGISSSTTALRGLPASAASRSAISSPRSSIRSAIRSSARARSSGGIVAQLPSNASFAAATAAVDIGFGRERRLGDRLAGGRVDHLLGRPLDRVDRLAADEVPQLRLRHRRHQLITSAVVFAVSGRVQAQRLLDRHVARPHPFGHRRVGHLAAGDVDPEPQAGVAPDRLGDAVVGEGDRVGQRRVGERVGRGDRDRAGHVGDAVVDDPVDLEGRARGGWSVARSRSSRPGRSRRRPAPRRASSAPAARAALRRGRAPRGRARRRSPGRRAGSISSIASVVE